MSDFDFDVITGPSLADRLCRHEDSKAALADPSDRLTDAGKSGPDTRQLAHSSSHCSS